MVKLLGIDPGLRFTGWGIIAADGNRLRHIADGVIATDSDTSVPERLKILHDALSALWDFVGASNKAVDESAPWALAKRAKAGDVEAETKLRLVLGDLVEACRLVGLAAAPFMPGAAPKVLEQLGYAYEYAPDGNGGPALLDRLAWGGQAGPGRVTPTPTPLFPRAETEAAAEEPA